MNVKQKLYAIQQTLKAPKGQVNSFGNYKYRSAEDILEAVKPLLKDHECILTLSDDIVSYDGRNYVRATAMLEDIHEGGEIVVTALAREAESKKGMDDSQVTGATSSYARKYALNGLFCIDDTKDPDTDEYTKKRQAAEGNDYATEQEKDALEEICAKHGLSVTDIISKVGWKKGTKLTKEQCGKAHIIIKEITNGQG